MDFLGVSTRASFYTPAMPDDSKGRFTASLPAFDEEYFEWVDLFESLAAARGDFTMIELGAGYGRWLVRAAFAARWFGNIPCRFVGVEAEPTHFAWMKQHFEDNGLDLKGHTLIRAAVSKHDGGAWFVVGTAGEWYGQRVVSIGDFWQIARRRLTIGGPKDSRPPNSGIRTAYRLRRVKTVSLKTLLRPLRKVDLIDLDVQGTELDVLSTAGSGLSAKVGRVHIGTHSHKVEAGLRSLFKELGWRALFDFPMETSCKTPWGEIRFSDGVQSWVNPGFLSQS